MFANNEHITFLIYFDGAVKDHKVGIITKK
jgi:hypothetical protein